MSSRFGPTVWRQLLAEGPRIMARGDGQASASAAGGNWFDPPVSQESKKKKVRTGAGVGNLPKTGADELPIPKALEAPKDVLMAVEQGSQGSQEMPPTLSKAAVDVLEMFAVNVLEADDEIEVRIANMSEMLHSEDVEDSESQMCAAVAAERAALMWECAAETSAPGGEEKRIRQEMVT